MRFNNDATTRVDSTVDYPTDGTWMHVAATYDGATIRLYYNGVEQASRAWSGSIGVNDTPLGIGGQSDGLRGLIGSIDDVRVYGRALSAAEIGCPRRPSSPATRRRWRSMTRYSADFETSSPSPRPASSATTPTANGDPLTAVKVTDPAHGTLTFSADGSFTYMPDAGLGRNRLVHLQGERRHG